MSRHAGWLRPRARGGLGHGVGSGTGGGSRAWPGPGGEVRSVYKELTGFLGAVLCPQGVEDAVTVRAAVGVRAEVVAQALDEGGGQAFGAQRVVIGQGGRESGHGDAEAD